MEHRLYNSKIGPILITGDSASITELTFIDELNVNKYSSIKEDDLPIFLEAKNWLDIYFSHNVPSFIPRIKINYNSNFQNLVLEEVKKIPYGSTITYGEIANRVADKLGIKKMSAQAVGHAVGSNPLPLIIPCHRVVGSNNHLGGYAFGVNLKKELLKLEGIDISKYKL